MGGVQDAVTAWVSNAGIVDVVGGGGAAAAPNPEGREVRERGGQEGNIVSMVRSQAQEMSQQVQRAPGQN